MKYLILLALLTSCSTSPSECKEIDVIVLESKDEKKGQFLECGD